MSSLNQWIEKNYNDLVKKYAGHWVLIKDQRVIFADRSFKLVYERAEKLNLKPDECKIEFIDSGDAVFYEITVHSAKI
jgi:hypothetical protein